VGLAVGDTQEEREKATLSKLALQVNTLVIDLLIVLLITHIQVTLALEIEERLPSIRLYFSEKYCVLTKNAISSIPKIPLLPVISFSSKQKAVHAARDNNSNLIDELLVSRIASINWL